MSHIPKRPSQINWACGKKFRQPKVKVMIYNQKNWPHYLTNPLRKTLQNHNTKPFLPLLLSQIFHNPDHHQIISAYKSSKKRDTVVITSELFGKPKLSRKYVNKSDNCIIMWESDLKKPWPRRVKATAVIIDADKKSDYRSSNSEVILRPFSA